MLSELVRALILICAAILIGNVGGALASIKSSKSSPPPEQWKQIRRDFALTVASLGLVGSASVLFQARNFSAPITIPTLLSAAGLVGAVIGVGRFVWHTRTKWRP